MRFKIIKHFFRVSPGAISTPLVDQVLGGKVDTEKAKKAIGDLHV